MVGTDHLGADDMTPRNSIKTELSRLHLGRPFDVHGWTKFGDGYVVLYTLIPYDMLPQQHRCAYLDGSFTLIWSNICD